MGDAVLSIDGGSLQKVTTQYLPELGATLAAVWPVGTLEELPRGEFRK